MKKYIKNTNFSLFISISHNLKLFWKNLGLDESKLITLHDGVYLKNFHKKIDRNTAKNKLSLPKDKKVVMYVGSLYPDREIENIIKLAELNSDLFFCIVGGPEKFKDYYYGMSKSRQINNINFTGQRPFSEISNYLFSADVLLALWSKKVPTINYCSPLKLFEYMASGNIVVAHDFITIKEIIKHRENGYLVDHNDFNTLNTALKDIFLNLDKDKIAQNAREEVFRKYSWDQRAKSIINFLK